MLQAIGIFCKPSKCYPSSLHSSNCTNIVNSSNGKSKMRFDEVGSQVLRVSRANRRVNMSIRIFSSAVRTFISQRSLTSLAEAIECEKDPYDGLLNQSDDTIDKTHKKSQKLIGTSHDEQNEKKMSFSMGIGNLNIIQPKAEGHIRPSAIKTASWGDFYRRPSNSKDNTAREWKSYNLLSLGCKNLSAILFDHANHRIGQMRVVSVVTGRF